MSIDRIAEIKRKIMTRKRATIKGDDDYNPEVPQVEVRRWYTNWFERTSGIYIYIYIYGFLCVIWTPILGSMYVAM